MGKSLDIFKHFHSSAFWTRVTCFNKTINNYGGLSSCFQKAKFCTGRPCGAALRDNNIVKTKSHAKWDFPLYWPVVGGRFQYWFPMSSDFTISDPEIKTSGLRTQSRNLSWTSRRSFYSDSVGANHRSSAFLPEEHFVLWTLQHFVLWTVWRMDSWFKFWKTCLFQ